MELYVSTNACSPYTQFKNCQIRAITIHDFNYDSDFGYGLEIMLSSGKIGLVRVEFSVVSYI